MNIGFIGAGATASTLAMALSAVKYSVTAVASKNGVSARRLAERVRTCEAMERPQDVAAACDLVFIATPDDVIAEIAASTQWKEGQWVAHCSGALGLDALAEAGRRKALAGSFHPLQTLTLPSDWLEARAVLQGVTFAVEAPDPLNRALHRMARDLGGFPVFVPPDQRALYHASAVMDAGYLLALLSHTADLWEKMGFTRQQAMSALLPMARQTLTNATRRGLDRAVTGPIVRGDIGTVRRHLDALKEKAPDTLPLYCRLGLVSLGFAKAKGVSEASVQEMEALLRSYLPKQDRGRR